MAVILVTAVAIAQRRPFPPRPQGKLENKVFVDVKEGYRFIFSNGIPDHKPGQFPNRNNPNVIQPQRHAFRMLVKPQAAPASPPSIPMERITM